MVKISISQELIQKSNKLSEKCIDCKKCMKNCPMLKEFCSSPKELLENISRQGEVESEIPYSCTLCNSCTEVCPKGINLKEFFLELRTHTAKEHKKVLKSMGYNVVKFHQINSFSKLFTASKKDVDCEKTTRAFIPGCSLTAYSPEIVMKTYEYLKEILPGTGIILKCCGNPTHSVGKQSKFKEYYSQLQQEIDKMNVDEIIVACENCYKTIKENSPNVKVISLWEIIAEFGVTESMKNRYENVDITFAIHDPCPIRKETQIHESIREITKQLGVKTKEFEYCKENTLCCGAGGMVAVTNNKIAVNQMKNRAFQTNCEYILTYCESCAESLTIGEKQGVHILDLMFNEEMYSNLNFKQVQSSTLKKWKNRYQGKKMIQKIR